jgi:hypothetical protein
MAARAIRDDDADNSLLIKECSSAINCCSVDVRFCATRWPQCGRYPAAGVKGITVERSSNRVGAAVPARPPMLVIGIIGGMADCVPAGAAAPVQANGTVSAPTEVARPGHERYDDKPWVRDWSPQTQKSPTLSGGGPLRDPAIDAGPSQQPERTPRCPRPSAGHDRGAAVHPSSCRG